MYTLLLRYQVISRQQVRKFDQKLERLAGEFNSYTGGGGELVGDVREIEFYFDNESDVDEFSSEVLDLAHTLRVTILTLDISL